MWTYVACKGHGGQALLENIRTCILVVLIRLNSDSKVKK